MFLRMLAVIAVMAPATAHAAAIDSIRACAAEVQRSTGRAVNEFDAQFQQRFLQTSLVRWPGIVCEVRGTQIWSLTIDGVAEVVSGWPSVDAKLAYDQLDAATAEAIRTLETRKQLLSQRLREAEAALRTPGADIVGVEGYVRDGIGQAIGQ
jgi:hypothetical protein